MAVLSKDYPHNAPPSMGALLLSTEVKLATGAGQGSGHWTYAANQFSNVMPGQLAMARYDPNSHIRRRGPGEATEAHYHNLPEIRYENQPPGIRHYAAASYHLDHSPLKTSATYKYRKKTLTALTYAIRHMYIMFTYSDMIWRTVAVWQEYYRIWRVDMFLWDRELTGQWVWEKSDPITVGRDRDAWDDFNPVIRKPDKMEAAIPSLYMTALVNAVFSSKIAAAVWALSLRYTFETDIRWDGLYIGPVYSDPTINRKHPAGRFVDMS